MFLVIFVQKCSSFTVFMGTKITSIKLYHHFVVTTKLNPLLLEPITGSKWSVEKFSHSLLAALSKFAF